MENWLEVVVAEPMFVLYFLGEFWRFMTTGFATEV
jgi:hypothetical protein